MRILPKRWLFEARGFFRMETRAFKFHTAHTIFFIFTRHFIQPIETYCEELDLVALDVPSWSMPGLNVFDLEGREAPGQPQDEDDSVDNA